MTTTEQHTAMTPEQAAWFADTFEKIVTAVGGAVVGKANVIRLVVTTMLSGGHMLLEDVPGTGKPQLARSLAAAVQTTSSRIQFTPDLLPSDVTGVSILDPKSQQFEFHRHLARVQRPPGSTRPIAPGRSRLPIDKPMVPALRRSENSVVPHSVQKPRRMPLSELTHPTGPSMASPAKGTMTRA